jgi:hypothetical protein
MKPKTAGRQIQLTFPLEKIESRKHRAGSFRRHDHVSEALKDALKNCGLAREVVAEELSRLTGDQISVNHLNNWTAESKNGWRLPLEYAAAISVITGDIGIVKAALEGSGVKVLDEEEAAIYELGRITAEDMKRKKKKKEVMEKLGI